MIDDNEGELELTSDFATFEQEQNTPEAEQPKVETEPEAGQDGTGEEPEAEEEVEAPAEAEPERKGKSVSERIDELVADKHEARREADYWRGVAEGRIKPAAEPEAEQPAVETPARPSPSDFEFGEADPAYMEALTDWKVDVKLAEREKVAEATRQQEAIGTAVQQLETAYTERVSAVKAEIPDYDEVVTKTAARGEWPCPPLIAIAAKESEVGPKALHHLATHRDEAIAIAKLSPIEQAVAWGRLEGRFLGQSAPQPKIATESPEPAPGRARGSSGRFATAPDTQDFAAFERMAMNQQG